MSAVRFLGRLARGGRRVALAGAAVAAVAVTCWVGWCVAQPASRGPSAVRADSSDVRAAQTDERPPFPPDLNDSTMATNQSRAGEKQRSSPGGEVLSIVLIAAVIVAIGALVVAAVSR